MNHSRITNGISKWLGDRLLGREKRALHEALTMVLDARRLMISPESMLRSLSELDSQLVDLIVRQRGYDPIHGLPGALGGFRLTDADRRYALEYSRYMCHYDVMVARAVRMWTDFGFGQRVQVAPRDPSAKAIWNEFWNSPVNAYLLGQAELHELSNNQVRDGEQFFVFWVSTLDGFCTLRKIAPEYVTRIVHDKDDDVVPVWYVRSAADGDIYYPDWRADADTLARNPVPAGAKSVDDLRPETRAVVLHLASNKVNGRGWPLLWQALEWARAYKDFLGDRATVARAVAMYVDKLKVKGGSRAVNDVISRLESTLARTDSAWLDRNPPAAAGSDWVENESISRERMPLSTGAGDAQIDGMTLVGQFGTGAGMPLHFLNRPDAMQNRGVARESAPPWYEQMQRYQTFWGESFSDMVEIVLTMHERYGQQPRQFVTYDADVTLDALHDADIDSIVSVVDTLNTCVTAGTVKTSKAIKAIEALLKLALNVLGVRDVATVLKDDESDVTTPPQTPEAAQMVLENWKGGRISTVELVAYLAGELESIKT